MKKTYFPLIPLILLTACDSGDISNNGTITGTQQSDIVISEDPRELLTALPSIDFNGQYQTRARPEMGTVADTGSGDATRGTETDAIAISSPASADIATGGSADSGAGASISTPLPLSPIRLTPVGLLTAGDYDDHLNPYLYQNYASDYLQHRGQWIDTPRLDFNNRIHIEVVNMGGAPYADAKVEVISGAGQSTTLQTAANGKTSLYTDLDTLPANFNLRVTGTDGTVVQKNIDLQTASKAGEIRVILAAENESRQASPVAAPIDLMFAIDTTGSMGDELRFLQAELSNIINAITMQQSGIRIGLVFYRDYGDAYVVRAHDFTDDLNSVQLNLNQESARGGGDYPEAMDQALQAAIGAEWRTKSRKVMFLIGDAPPHSDRMRASWKAAEQARTKNIHIVPVAASGVAEDAEYIMRSIAALTNSRYIFLTDDSGLGSPHAEPEIDCYVVTSLRSAMIRTLNSLVSGTRIEPAANDIIRQEGNYNQGVCDQPDTPNPDTSVNNTVLVNQQLPLNGTLTEQRISVIKDQNTLNLELANYGEAAVSVDFNKGQVLLLDMGTKPTGGYSIGLGSFEDAGDHVIANFGFNQAGSCVVTTALTNPFTFVYVETLKEIRTVETSVRTVPGCIR